MAIENYLSHYAFFKFRLRSVATNALGMGMEFEIYMLFALCLVWKDRGKRVA